MNNHSKEELNAFIKNMRDIKKILREELRGDFNKEIDNKIPKILLKHSGIFYMALVIIIGSLGVLILNLQSDVSEIKSVVISSQK